mmetsp:Transcript_51505/g.137454  ORF Transcript_51505/g.137454 Transcript_51505/m.137454 type:complete len:83 (+) Transcript_51505:628-876(+)
MRLVRARGMQGKVVKFAWNVGSSLVQNSVWLRCIAVMLSASLVSKNCSVVGMQFVPVVASILVRTPAHSHWGLAINAESVDL